MKNLIKLMCVLPLAAGLLWSPAANTNPASDPEFVLAVKCQNKGADSSPSVSDTGQDSDAACQEAGSDQKCNRVRTETAVRQSCTPFDKHCCLPYEFKPYTCTWKCQTPNPDIPKECKCCYKKVEGNMVTQLQTVGCIFDDPKASKCEKVEKQADGCNGKKCEASWVDCSAPPKDKTQFQLNR